MVLPIVFINIAAGEDQWIFDYRVTFFFGEDQPYSWTVSGVILDQDHHKHMGVYNGRPFPTLFNPPPPLAANPFPRNKSISLDFVGQKLQELLNSRQGLGSPDPLIKLKLDSVAELWRSDPTVLHGFAVHRKRSSRSRRPASRSQLPDGRDLFARHFGIGAVHDVVRARGLSQGHQQRASDPCVNSGDNQTPLTMTLQFETDGPKEIQGSISMDVIKFEIIVRLTLRFHQPTAAVDLFGWVDDINGITYTPQSVGPTTIYTVTGTFLGQPVSGQTTDPAEFKTQLIGKVVDVVFTTSSVFDPGGAIQKRIREGIFNRLSDADAITKVTLRDSINATASSWLMGGVIASGNGELVPYPNPCTLQAVSVNNDVLTLNYISPEKTFVYEAPPDWPTLLAPGALAEIDHIVVLTQENRSFDHMLGYLSLPLEKGGMNRKDVDGLKGGEFNMFNGRKIQSFRLAAGDTIFSPGPPNSSERTAAQVNGGKMDGFVQAQADECGPATAHRVMGYHTADNVPTYNSLARDFAICHRWFASHPGPTFPNRFYELTGRPNIDPWGAWEYANSSPLRPVLTDTIFDLLSRTRGLLDLLRALLLLSCASSSGTPSIRRTSSATTIPSAGLSPSRNRATCLRCRSSIRISSTILRTASATSLPPTSATASPSSGSWSRRWWPVRSGTRRCSSSPMTSTAASTIMCRRFRRPRSLPRCFRPRASASRASWCRRGSRAARCSARTPCTSTTRPF